MQTFEKLLVWRDAFALDRFKHCNLLKTLVFLLSISKWTKKKEKKEGEKKHYVLCWFLKYLLYYTIILYEILQLRVSKDIPKQQKRENNRLKQKYLNVLTESIPITIYQINNDNVWEKRSEALSYRTISSSFFECSSFMFFGIFTKPKIHAFIMLLICNLASQRIWYFRAPSFELNKILLKF